MAPPPNPYGQVALHIPVHDLHWRLSGGQPSLPCGPHLHDVYLVIFDLVINVSKGILEVVFFVAGFFAICLKMLVTFLIVYLGISSYMYRQFYN